MKTYADIKAQIDKLQAEAERLRDAEKAGVIGRIKEAIAVYDITALDLGLGASGSRKPAVGATPSQSSSVGLAKYRDPASGKTWTGRGKPPNWILGQDRESFLIGGASRAPGAAPAKAGRKASTKVKAKSAKTVNVGVPKYRDAASGKTWTGRGKPPAWIVGASNRDDFLIDAPAA